MTLHIQVILERFSQSGTPGWYYLDQKTLDTLVALLSYSLQTAVTGHDLTPETSNSADTKWALESDSHEENNRNAAAPSNGRIPESSSGGSISTQQTVQLVADILQTASDLMLVREKHVLLHIYSQTHRLPPFIWLLLILLFFQKYILFHKAQECRVSTSLITLYAAYQDQTSTVISSGSTSFYMPASLIQLLFDRLSGRKTESGPCVLSMLTELAHSPYAWARYPGGVRLAWHDDTWQLNDRGIALIFLWWFPGEWTSGRPEFVRVQHEEEDPHSLPHSANKHRAATTTRKRMFFCLCCLQQVDSICTVSRQWSTLLNESRWPCDHIHSAEELCAWVRPPALPGQLPQLQHYPGALAAGHPAECGVQAATQQGVSHHAAL